MWPKICAYRNLNIQYIFSCTLACTELLIFLLFSKPFVILEGIEKVKIITEASLGLIYMKKYEIKIGISYFIIFYNINSTCQIPILITLLKLSTFLPHNWNICQNRILEFWLVQHGIEVISCPCQLLVWDLLFDQKPK